MTQNIVTGPHPGQPGACIAHYNHFNHSPNPNHMVPYIQQPITVPSHYGIPSWRPPGASFPYLY